MTALNPAQRALDKTTQEFTPIMLSKEAHGEPWVEDAPVDDTMLSATHRISRVDSPMGTNRPQMFAESYIVKTQMFAESYIVKTRGDAGSAFYKYDLIAAKER